MKRFSILDARVPGGRSRRLGGALSWLLGALTACAGPSASTVAPAAGEPETWLVTPRGYYGAGLDLHGGLGFIEVERDIGSRMSVGLSAGGYSYRWEQVVGFAIATHGGGHDIVEEQDGVGLGLATDVRWYVGPSALRGFYFGLGVGAFYEWWRWELDSGPFFSETDRGGGGVLDLHSTMGVVIPLGPSFRIIPEGLLGYWAPLDDRPGTASLGLFAGVGVRLGWAF